MRYIKVLLLVLLFFLVMLFFVQNQAAFSQAMPLKLDLLLVPPMESAPLPLYSLMLFCFVLGALCTIAMLIWDRLTLGTKLTFAHMRVRSLEKDLIKSQKSIATTQEQLVAAETKASEAEAKAKEAMTKAKEAIAEANLS